MKVHNPLTGITVSVAPGDVWRVSGKHYPVVMTCVAESRAHGLLLDGKGQAIELPPHDLVELISRRRIPLAWVIEGSPAPNSTCTPAQSPRMRNVGAHRPDGSLSSEPQPPSTKAKGSIYRG